jgi:hypothetical protein
MHRQDPRLMPGAGAEIDVRSAPAEPSRGQLLVMDGQFRLQLVLQRTLLRIIAACGGDAGQGT